MFWEPPRPALHKSKLHGLCLGLELLLKGSSDLVTTVTVKVAILIITFNPIRVSIALLTKPHDPPSRVWGFVVCIMHTLTPNNFF